MTAGFHLTKYEINRSSTGIIYEGEAYNEAGDFIQFASDSFEGAMEEIMEAVYNTDNVEFFTVISVS